MPSLLDIVNTLRYNVIYTRTLDLRSVDVASITSGNNTVIARCRLFDKEEDMLLKCYHRPKRNTSAIYGDSFIANELGLYTLCGKMEYVDVVLTPWIEGEALDYYFQNPEADYRSLSRSFDSLSLATLSDSMAHGDIKPENIIVTPGGAMRLIDLDAAWVPGFGDDDVEEYGSPSYSHPQRLHQHFDKYIDDFSIALLSTTLAALAVNRELFEPLINPDNTLFDPVSIVKGRDHVLDMAIDILERHGDMAHSDIAKRLYGCNGHIEGLEDALKRAVFGV